MKVHSSGRELVLQPDRDSGTARGRKLEHPGRSCLRHQPGVRTVPSALGVFLGPCLLNGFMLRLRAEGNPASCPTCCSNGCTALGLAWTAGSRRKPCSGRAAPCWERSSAQRLLVAPLGQVTCRFSQSMAKSAWEKPPSLLCQLLEARIGPTRFTLCFWRAVTTSLAVAASTRCRSGRRSRSARWAWTGAAAHQQRAPGAKRSDRPHREPRHRLLADAASPGGAAQAGHRPGRDEHQGKHSALHAHSRSHTRTGPGPHHLGAQLSGQASHSETISQAEHGRAFRPVPRTPADSMTIY